MNFVKVALFALLLVAVLLPVSTPSVSTPLVSAHLEACKDGEGKPHHYNYSQECAAENTRCGSFCFYAVCHTCTPWTHTHSCGEDCSYSHTGHKSPCTLWHWNIFPHPDPGLTHPIDKRTDRYRASDRYEAPNLNESLAFGMLRDDYEHPGSPCTVEEGSKGMPVEQFLTDGKDLKPVDILKHRDPSYVSGGWKTDDGYRINSLVDSRSSGITLGDLSHLPRTPGEPGAATLISVTKVTDSSVTLQVSGGGRVQYRYWGYYGVQEPSADGLELFEVAPSGFRVPFHDLLGGEILINRAPGQSGEHIVGLEPGPSGEIIVDRELQGIFSFQVRSLDADGVSTGNSNILHEMIGMADFAVIRPSRRDSLPFSLPIPAPPAWGTPMPPPGEGEPLRPARPSIVGVSQVLGAVRTVEVVLAADYSDDVEYRWWPHSGALPTPAFDEWLPVLVSGGKFLVPRVEPRIPGNKPYSPVFADISDIPDVAVFNFQVRLVNAEKIPGDASDVKVLRVWGGNYPGWVTGPPPPLPPQLPEPWAPPMIPILQWSEPPPTMPPPPPRGLPQGFYCGVPAGEVSSNPGLLSDCQILLELADQAFGTPRLNWAKPIFVEDRMIEGIFVEGGMIEGIPVEEWTGVELEGSPRRVRGVVLNDAGLVGVIPWSFGKLFSLRTLDLRDNGLQGNIPLSLTALHQLETLDLRDNGLVGYLPDLTTLHHLEHLRLDRNDLTGVLTDKLDGLNMLTSVGFSDNSFFGVIPPELAGYGLDVIRVAGNRFSGCIPPGLRSVRDNDIDSLVQSEESLVGPVNC